MGAGLRPGAKATETPPDPNVGAPVLDSTRFAKQPEMPVSAMPTDWEAGAISTSRRSRRPSTGAIVRAMPPVTCTGPGDRPGHRPACAGFSIRGGDEPRAAVRHIRVPHPFGAASDCANRQSCRISGTAIPGAASLGVSGQPHINSLSYQYVSAVTNTLARQPSYAVIQDNSTTATPK